MAKLTLQEQLLQSGLVGSAQARAVKSEKHKQTRQQHHNKTHVPDAAKEQAQKARLEQAEKDRELNQKRKQEEDRRELAAQIKQLIEQNRLPQDTVITDESIAYHFTDKNRVKTLYVSKILREQITQGKLGIIRWGQNYEIVPAETALKIKERDEHRVIALNETISSNENQDDPYADFQVPDDLVW